MPPPDSEATSTDQSCHHTHNRSQERGPHLLEVFHPIGCRVGLPSWYLALRGVQPPLVQRAAVATVDQGRTTNPSGQGAGHGQCERRCAPIELSPPDPLSDASVRRSSLVYAALWPSTLPIATTQSG